MKYDIFVSYRRTDRELVAAIVRRLEARGVSVWYDANVEGGSDRPKVAEALGDSAMLVLIFSAACNEAKQPADEIALADEQGKPVVTVLIEDVTPKGVYLEELSDRNLIGAFPDVMGRIDELVDHLATLAGKPPAATRLAAKAANDVTAKDGATPEAANDHQISRAADAYVGKASLRGRKAKTSDILPLNLIDLVVLVLLVGGAGWLAVSRGEFVGGDGKVQPIPLAGAVLVLIGVYAAVVLPVRSYIRRRGVGRALLGYLISTGIIFALGVGALLYSEQQGLLKIADPMQGLVTFLAAWLGFTIVAFLIYGVVGSQRALRSFRSNLRKI